MSVPHDPRLALSQLAYEQAAAMLEHQRDAVETYGTRATALFAAAVVSTSLFGGWVLGDGRFGLFSWLAIAAFVLVTAECLSVAAPRGRTEFTLRSEQLLDAAERDRRLLDPGAAHRALARYISSICVRNDAVVARIATRLQIAAAFEGVAVVCWVADLVVRA